MSAPSISNSSPIIALERVGLVHLLHDLYGEIVVPTAVVDEVGQLISVHKWIRISPISQTIPPVLDEANLGLGEKEAITLAIEIKPARLILDDRPARRLAQSLGLPVIGTLGVLVEAKQNELIHELKPILGQLIAAEFRIGNDLLEKILSDIGEM